MLPPMTCDRMSRPLLLAIPLLNLVILGLILAASRWSPAIHPYVALFLSVIMIASQMYWLSLNRGPVNLTLRLLISRTYLTMILGTVIVMLLGLGAKMNLVAVGLHQKPALIFSVVAALILAQQVRYGIKKD